MAQARGLQTRTRILEAAQSEFARHGYDATGVAELCRVAGVTKGAFYHHFPSKQEVFLELLSSWLSALDEQARLVVGTDSPAPDELLSMARMSSQVLVDAHGQLPMFLEFWAQAARDPSVWQATVAPYRRYRSLFAELVRRGVKDGSLRPVEPEDAARTILALAVGMVLQGLLDPEGADWGQAMEGSIRLILDGLRRRS